MQIKSISAVLFLSLLGLSIAGYLLISYSGSRPVLCFNTGCETVRNSSYSNLFGLPVPLFGVLGYSAIALICIMSVLRKFPLGHIKKLLLFFGIFGFVLSAYFTYLEAFVIRAWCLWCVISAVIMTAIFLLTAKTSIEHN